MNENELKPYHELCVDLWKLFRTYYKSVTETTAFNMVEAANELKKKHEGCTGADQIVHAVMMQLLAIRELDTSIAPKTRMQTFFGRALNMDGNQLLWDTAGVWMDSFTAFHPDYALDVIDRLRILLTEKGHPIGFDELRDYAEAGWSLALRRTDPDDR